MKRAGLLLPLLILLAAARFAALSIEPYGDQVFDLATGVTTLPQGGVIRDNANDLSIDAEYVEYKEDVYVLARKAKSEAGKVRFAAEQLRYELPEDRVQLEGGVVLDTPQVKALEARSAWIFLGDGVAVLEGGVRAMSPELEAQAMISDYRTGETLLLAPYRYRDAALGVTLSGKNPEKPLYLKFDAETGEVRASSKLDPEVRKRLWAFLARTEPKEAP
ncbi:MAG TPA: hypothetical protein ENJ85_01070 [Oceanithermus profundus]|uniref:OstA family protein n=1 Tax=Oceanithermus profundus TaxID=187137 RepID=A0A7C5SRW5_9DEIN|nr:hypothetical protein [Oceanithermus profundus]